ncbi:MAG: hypothetical protein LC799_11620, partial [Actinobacteria bacterium]|nr:hypothetical protein [Actinomycetota bacterium]
MIGRLTRLPVAARMAALTSGALIALLVLVAVLVHRQFGSALREEVDRELIDVARFVAAAVEDASGHELSELLGSKPGGPTAAAPSGLQAQLMSPTGAVVAASDGLVGVEGLVRGGALVRVAADVPVYGDATVKGRTYRFVGVSVEDGSGRILAVAAPIEDLVDAEKTLLAAYVPAAAAAAAVAAFAGWW